MSNDVMSRRTFLTIKACQKGANFWETTEAIASVAIDLGWDLEESKTWEEWDDEDE